MTLDSYSVHLKWAPRAMGTRRDVKVCCTAYRAPAPNYKPLFLSCPYASRGQCLPPSPTRRRAGAGGLGAAATQLRLSLCSLPRSWVAAVDVSRVGGMLRFAVALDAAASCTAAVDDELVSRVRRALLPAPAAAAAVCWSTVTRSRSCGRR